MATLVPSFCRLTQPMPSERKGTTGQGWRAAAFDQDGENIAAGVLNQQEQHSSKSAKNIAKAHGRQIIPVGAGITTLGVVLFLSLVGLSSPQRAQAQTTINICDRTPQVKTKILMRLGKTSADCGSITAAELAGIRTLSVRNSGITALKDGDFDGLTGLGTLNLYENNLRSLPSGVFDKLTKLEWLNLDENDLGSLPSGLFDKLTSLEFLNLGDNNLSSLPSGVFDKLTKLEWLKLDCNNLSLSPGMFDKLTSLRGLWLSANNLSSLPSGVFDKLTSLEGLLLGYNNLSSLPSGVFDKLTSLEGLELGDNNLRSLPAGMFDKLTSLRTLYLGDNNLRGLPAGVFDKLTSLEALWIIKNNLRSLPPNVFDKLTSLGRLYLWGNSLICVPSIPSSVSVLWVLEIGQGPGHLPPCAWVNIKSSGTIQVSERTGAANTDTYRVGPLATEPTSSVTITVTSGDTGAATVSPAALTFSTSNWNTAQTVTVTGVDDAVVQSSGRSVTISHSATSTDATYNGITIADVTALVDDCLRCGVTIWEFHGTTQVSERTGPEHTDAYAMALDTKPRANVTIAVTSGDTGAATVSPATLTFTPTTWNTAQVVTVTGVDDAVAQNSDRRVTISHSATSGDAAYNGITIADVTALVADGCFVSDAKWNTVSGYYASNAKRAPDYGANWYRVLIAYAQERTDKTLPRWGSTTSKPTTPYTAAEAEEREKIWDDWTPVRETLECLEKVYTPVPQSGQPQVSGPEISLTAGAAVTEGDNAVFTVEANPAPQSDLTVQFSLSQEGEWLATPGAGTHTLTLTAGTTSADLTVFTENDSVDESDGSISVSIDSGTDYTVAAPPNDMASVTVQDDDDSPAQSIGAASCDTASLETDIAGYISEQADGTPHVTRWKKVLAAFGNDNGYTEMTAAEALTYANRGWSRWDPVVEALTCLETAGSVDPDPAPEDEPDPEPGITLTGGGGIIEGGNAVFTVHSNPAPPSELTVTLNVDDDGAGDFLAQGDEGTQTVTIPAGQTSATLTLATENDSTDEPDGSVSATVASGTGYTVGNPSTATVTVNDDDDPPITTPTVSITGGNGITEGGAASFTLTATPAPQSDITVQVAVADSGSFATSGQTSAKSVTIGATGTTTLTVATADDGVNEANGSIAATIQPGNGYAVATSPDNEASVTVSDNDEPTVSITGGDGVTEGTPASFNVTANPAPHADLTVTVAVTQNGDYAASGETGTREVTIPTTGAATLTVATADDDTDEPDGSIIATIQAGNGYAVGTSPDNGASVAVADNDAAPGLPSFSVDDAEANESKFRLPYTIRLSRASDRRVSVWVHTRESNPVSARDGVDYVGMGWGTRVVFPPGETERHLWIQLINDSHDEGSETFQVELLSPQGGATIADGVGVMTIVNSDPLPAAWHLRFGRTVSQQVVDALQNRFSSPAPLETGLQLALAGEDFTSDTPLAENQGLLSKALGFENVTPQLLVEGSSFSFAPQGEAGPQFALWGQGALSSFSGQEEELSLDGDVTTLLLGADWSTGRWLAGAALSHSWGNGSYDGEDDQGEISASLTGLFPYGRYALSPRLNLWATAGYGWGQLSLKPDDTEEEYKPDTTMTMVALGMDGLLLDGGSEGVSLNATADLLSLNATSDEVEGLESSEGNVSRLRLGLEATRPFPLANGSSLLPSMEVGIRQDGGNAETGFGMDLGAGIAWKDPQRGISAELKGRTLLSHAEEEFQDQGLALSFSWDPSPSNRGPSLSMGHAMGVVESGGLDALLHPTTFEQMDGNPSSGQRFEAELAYGFPVHNDRLTLTPAVAMTFSSTTRTYGLLWSVTPYSEQSHALPWELSIEAERLEYFSPSTPADHSLKLNFSSSF